MARSLRGTLEAGAPCPVCEQVVAAVPTLGRAPAIATAERALERTRRDEAKARDARQAAAAAAAAADERLSSAHARREELDAGLTVADEAARLADAALAAAKSELVDRLGQGDPRALLAERAAELARAAELVERATSEASEAREALDRAREEGARGRDDLAAIANRLASVRGMLGDPSAVSADPEDLRTTFVATGEAVIEGGAAAAEALAGSRHDAEAALERARQAAAGAGLDPDDDFGLALATAAAERGAAEQQVRGLTDTLEAGADLEARLEAVRDDRAVASRLAADLQPGRFLAFLLEEERRALAELGSAHVEELTGGAYRFTDDDRFEIVDLQAAGTERRSDSLSGGETFLASLALALALAEIVARGGGRLDAFFLDEGFGSLDPEHLDRAMDGIGRLVANDPRRLVVLVSHVEQMREMLEDLIVLDTDERTGDTIVVRGATPGS
jgi:exonuclease SbcC